ncbi:uncharacterized protein Gasu_01840 [Galdieria sulphuraria]|uniref:Sulfotransferase n=1 Tax=Galdieria sulphuraria TaxID=130081 RepID=M2X8E5_GALSU|nr:uncharacterized protein Gasu_01840 [Galdieria sulphuraria]EME32825.1 hypothetical protein Gasu_01840 [Galdieria sulphuraria]|eukprot:XP_005709345.1 hypothetical protein Gasu_01840 [Galdieria sulphuraria]
MFHDKGKLIWLWCCVGAFLLAIACHKVYSKLDLKQNYSRNYEFIFLFSCGRAGTKHFSKVFGDPDAFVTHQLDCNDKPTRELIADFYRPMLQSASFAELEKYVKNQLIPFMESNLKATGTRRYFYTGHVPFTFGLADYLLQHIQVPVKILRVRRGRIPLALSLLSMGPEEEDPWVEKSNVSKYRKRFVEKFHGLENRFVYKF